ncbi:MAG TPA: TonB-dependent receptor [Patescibacteria group bacterium]|nr:TonB-dependent receptor [Patescibacteria group bacterium]
MKSQGPRHGTWFMGISGLLVSLAFCIAGISALAQLPTASILGSVKDPSGAAIPGATVTATNTDTGATRTVATDSQGNYNLVELPVGNYTLKVSHTGFKSASRGGITLSVTQQALINFKLEIGATQQTVTVTGAVPLVNTQSATLGGLVNNQTLEQLPLNGRNYINLTLLQPGVVQQRNVVSAGGIQNGTQFSVNGAPTRANNFMLDGAVLQNLSGVNPSGLTGTTLGMDGIQEFRILTSNFAAQYGLSMGSQIVMVSKSGTNKFHGDAYDYFRNNVLDARNYFAPPPAALFGHRNGAFNRNQFGGSIGGPIKKNKTFFDAVYEGVREKLGVVQDTVVPAAGCHPPGANAVNNYGAGAEIWDGTGTQPSGSVGPCPDLQALNLSQNYVTLSQYTAPFLSLFPLPNVTGPCGPCSYNYAGLTPVTENFGQLRIDQNISSSDSLFGRYTIDNSSYDNADASTGLSDIGGGSFQQYRVVGLTRNQYLTLAENHIFTPNLLNTFRLSFSRTHTHAADSYVGLPNNNLGFPIVPASTFVPNPAIGDMTIAFGGYSQLGPAEAYPAVFYLQNVYTLSDDVSWTHGNHSFMFGTLINRWNSGIGNTPSITGFLTYTDLAKFFQSTPRLIEYATPGSSGNRFWRYWTFGFYGQDQWRATSRLTVNLGLRYEFMKVPVEMNGRNSGLVNPLTDPFRLGPLMANNTLHDFSPRIGLAWDVFGNGKTAVRSGFGIYYSVGNIGTALQQGTIGTPPFSGLTDILNPEQTTGLGGPTTNIPLPLPANLYTSGSSTATPQFVQYNAKSPYMVDWNLSIQQELPFQVGLTVAYVGDRGVHLWDYWDSNPVFPTSFGSCGDPASLCVPGRTVQGLGSPLTIPTGVPMWDSGSANYANVNPNMPSTIEIATVADSTYNALEIALDKRTGHGLSFGSSFTWGKLLDDTQGQANVADCFASGGLSNQYPLNMAVDKGPACFNSPYDWQVNVVYHLPGLGSSGFVSKATNGWRMSGILSVQAGYPFSLNLASNRSGSGVLQGQPDMANINTAAVLSKYYPSSCVGGVASGCPYTPVLYNKSTVITGTVNQWYNPNMFSMAPTFESPTNSGGNTCANGKGACVGQLGTAPRDFLLGPPLRNFDFSIAKDTKVGFLGEAGSIDFRADFFNIFNHPNFRLSPNFGGIFGGNQSDMGPFSETPSSPSSQIVSTIDGNQREIQFSLTMKF